MERKFHILKAIIENFIISAEPVGSKFLLEKIDMDISPATIRNDMATLEKMGLLYQPYTSAGRMPTTQGFRMYVDDMMNEYLERESAQKVLAIDAVKKQAMDDSLYYAVSLLSRTCGNVVFATIPELGKAYYLGLSNILKTPEFYQSIEAYTVVKILEDKDKLIELLSELPLDEKTRVFIGEENIIEEIQSCSLIVTKFMAPNVGEGVIGILGPKRMNYAFNIAALEQVKGELEG